MTYAHVRNNAVQQTGTIPQSWKLTDGRWVSGFDLRPDFWQTEGWLPVEENRPDLARGEQYGPPTYTIAADKVTATYPVEPIPPTPPSQQSALVKLAQATVAAQIDTLTEADAVELAPLFDPWQAGETVAVGDIRSYDGTLVVCVQGHTTQADWTPDVVPALWTIKRDAATPAEWVQPTGAQDAYQIGDRVLFAGVVWESTNNSNVWQPGVFGWVQV